MSYFSAIRQEVRTSVSNNSATPLNAGATFTGTGESTLNVSGIRISFNSDQNCTIYVDQSMDGVVGHWDVFDSFRFATGDGGFALTVQATASYFRIRVTNTSTVNQTFLRLQVNLCPIVEAVPRALDTLGNLKTAVRQIEDHYGWHAENTPQGEMRVATPVRIVGTAFEGNIIDPNFWTTSATGTGASVAQANSQVTVTTGTASGASVTMFSARRARYIGGNSMRYRSVRRMDAGTPNNKRRWGVAWGSVAMPAVTDGAYFEMDGTTFSIVTNKGGVETRVSSGSFNGTLGLTHTPTIMFETYEIYWNSSSVFFVIGDDILHTVRATLSTWSDTLSFHAFADSLNAAAASSVVMEIRTSTIYRLGATETSPLYKFENTAVTAFVLKRGPGRIQRVIGGDNAAATLLLYDSVTATNQIAFFDLSKILGSVEFHFDFFTGLCYTTTGHPQITIVYE